jgi:hypothetical protein
LILVNRKNQGCLLVHSETQPPTLKKEKKRKEQQKLENERTDFIFEFRAKQESMK